MNDKQSAEVWLRSAACGEAGHCVEVNFTDAFVQVRDSKDPDGARLTFSRGEWEAFCAGVVSGQLTVDGRD